MECKRGKLLSILSQAPYLHQQRGLGGTGVAGKVVSQKFQFRQSNKTKPARKYNPRIPAPAARAASSVLHNHLYISRLFYLSFHTLLGIFITFLFTSFTYIIICITTSVSNLCPLIILSELENLKTWFHTCLLGLRGL